MSLQIGDKYLFVNTETSTVTSMTISKIYKPGRVHFIDKNFLIHEARQPLPSKKDYKQRMYAGYFVPDTLDNLLKEF